MFSDSELLKKYFEIMKTDNEKAKNKLYEDIYFTYHDSIKKFVYGKLIRINKQEKTEDIVQDVFLEMYINKDRIKIEYSMKSNLYIIALSKCGNYMKKEVRQSKINKQMYMLINFNDDIEKQIIEKEDYNILHKAINKLSIEEQQIIQLSEFEELKYKEIAEELGKSTSAIKTQNHRIKKKLKKIMEEEYGYNNKTFSGIPKIVLMILLAFIITSGTIYAIIKITNTVWNKVEYVEDVQIEATKSEEDRSIEVANDFLRKWDISPVDNWKFSISPKMIDGTNSFVVENDNFKIMINSVNYFVENFIEKNNGVKINLGNKKYAEFIKDKIGNDFLLESSELNEYGFIKLEFVRKTEKQLDRIVIRYNEKTNKFNYYFREEFIFANNEIIINNEKAKQIIEKTYGFDQNYEIKQIQKNLQYINSENKEISEEKLIKYSNIIRNVWEVKVGKQIVYVDCTTGEVF